MKKLNIRNILVPIDFSKMSIQAIETAKRLAQRFFSTVHLVHVHEFDYPAGFMIPPATMPGWPIPVGENTEKNLVGKLTSLARQSGLSPENFHVRDGSPTFDEICRLAREIRADLIVMPTQGHTGLKHVLLGSTAERVVQHSPCPVLVSRKTNKIDKMLVPIDFSGCSLEALNYAIEFAGSVAAKITLLHAVYLGYACTSDGYGMYDLSAITDRLRKNAEQQMREFVRAAKFGGVRFETIITIGSPVAEICAFAEDNDVDLIVMPTHGWTGFKHVLIGSTAEHVVRRAPCGVVVVPSHPSIRAANLTRGTERVRRTKGQIARKAAPRVNAEKENYTRNYRKLIAHPFPERRQTNKFRETHAHNGG